LNFTGYQENLIKPVKGTPDNVHLRRPGEGRNLDRSIAWIPACAGTTAQSEASQCHSGSSWNPALAATGSRHSAG